MLRRTNLTYPSKHYTFRDRVRPTEHRYKEVNRWQKQAMGGGDKLPGRYPARKERFNPESLLATKGTTKEQWKWWNPHRPFLPNVAPKGYKAPRPMGRLPAAWDEAFAASVLALSTPALKERIIERLTLVIFEESQRDGFELRKLDFEGKPLEELPEKRIIEQYVFEEETLRDRVLGQVLETDFRLTASSRDRASLRTVENIVNYIVAHVTAARPVRHRGGVADAVRDVLAAQPIQPVLGFEHALPHDNRDRLIQEWERMHQLDWQFGKAIYKPRSKEVVSGNFEWLRQTRVASQRQSFDCFVNSGKALAAHKAKIAAAAAPAE